MEKNRIKRFNENSELNISDVSESNDKTFISALTGKRYIYAEWYEVRSILELVRDKTITLDKGVERIIEYYSH